MGSRRPLGSSGSSAVAPRRVADVTDRAAVEAAAARIEAELGVPGLLVNNAGQIDVAPFSDADPATWWRVVEINLRGTFNWTQLIVGRMLAANRGRVLNITSPAAKSGPPTTTSYNVSKAAVSNLTSTLAAELPSIPVFALAPFGLTDMTRYLMDSDGLDANLAKRLRRLARRRAQLTAAARRA